MEQDILEGGRAYIYILIDPRDASYRYVGKAMDLVVRLNEHLRRSHETPTPKNNWLEKLKRLGLEPRLRVLMEVPEDVWQEAERAMIAYYRTIGAPLLNVTDGGDGCNGYTWTDEQREALGEISKAHWEDDAYRQKWEESDVERRKKLSRATKELYQDPEYIEKQRASDDYRSEQMKKFWADAKWRAEQIARQNKGVYSSIPWAAERLGVTPGLVRRWCRQGRLGHKEGRKWVITSEELEAFAKLPRLPGCTSEQAVERWQDEDYKKAQAKATKRRYAKDKKYRESTGSERAARILGVHKRTLLGYCRAGLLGTKVKGRWVITDEDLEGFRRREERWA